MNDIICRISGCNEPGVVIIPGKYSRHRKPFVRQICTKHWSEMSKNHWAKKRPAWSPGEPYIDKYGYVHVDVNGKIVLEHRVVMEKTLGRKLAKGESVHHKNGNTSDNSPENLELWVGRIRHGQRAVDITCPHCGKSYA